MSRYIISPEASQDLDEISDYFLSRSLAAGERFVNGFEEKCKNLVKFPNMGRSYADIEPSPLFSQVQNLLLKNANLRQTRDLLLPKLISGEIDVENLDINTGEIAA